MAREEDTIKLPGAPIILSESNLPGADKAPVVPTELAWFNLFNGIAESLKVQADATRAEMAAEEAFKGTEFSKLFDDILNPYPPAEEPVKVTADEPVTLTATDNTVDEKCI